MINKLTQTQNNIIEQLFEYLKKNYKNKQHHVATVFVCEDGSQYFALHLDIKGFDVCAEAIAMSNVLAEKRELDIVFVASALMCSDGVLRIVNPCGNCRQMLLQYIPKTCQICLEQNDVVFTTTPEKLLPYPY